MMMRYHVSIDIRGTDAAHHMLRLFPGLDMIDLTPRYKRQRDGYMPTDSTRYRIGGLMSSGHVDSLDLMNALASIGSAFSGVHIHPCIPDNCHGGCNA